MANFTLSDEAGQDLKSIAHYTLDRFGYEQARKYRYELHETLMLLTKRPGIGAGCEQIRTQTRRFSHLSHIIYYRPLKQGILVLRILHHSQDPLGRL
ncbi:type II toxin-antitoxin system RelE/ParE family toxin [Asticcacaulis excentricus]|uniref:Toxin n=1 Tax=Asticcacaulis excentricus (strain ATCC 15261 / DSM 4724 / KCTC 12464 / NCIMB 9791 / VKM B-1370 / CB 48) TaxID=573065 RepID=E8RRK4_ASTEC|nr:type II toxin-antitoxin system RelE/ParE family toxin [Asticcacaulis excentricus]ADU13449.1 plasmid stabilization system [Asticcacaulis excentricus CB 48]